MKFNALTQTTPAEGLLEAEYRSGREIGVITLGETCLFFKKGRKVFYLPYADITRAFRRVQMVPARMCCGKGDLTVENIVICDSTGELAMIQMPGERAAKGVMDELAAKAPQAELRRPSASEVPDGTEALNAN